jgi:hypothetical protein
MIKQSKNNKEKTIAEIDNLIAEAIRQLGNSDLPNGLIVDECGDITVKDYNSFGLLAPKITRSGNVSLERVRCNSSSDLAKILPILNELRQMVQDNKPKSLFDKTIGKLTPYLGWIELASSALQFYLKGSP